MMSADQMRELSLGIRARQQDGGPPPGSPEVDERLVGEIEGDVARYREEFWTETAGAVPPEPLRELLPLMGWLIYEASLDRTWDVKAQYETLAGEPGEVSRSNVALIRRLANTARALVWPHFGPRALGSIRCEALIESKRDTEAGYNAAYILHQEARERHASYRGQLVALPDTATLVLALDELLVQLALAETGTACRTAERVIGRWDQEFRQGDPELDALAGARWVQRMFRQLVDGVAIGERALTDGRRIKDDPTLGLVDNVDEDRLTIKTGLRNPSIMTCRAILLAYSLCPRMAAGGRMPPTGGSWDEYRRDLLKQFDDAFRTLRMEISRPDGTPWQFNDEHGRAQVQICLHLGLVTPSHPLVEPVALDAEYTLRVLDDSAVERMSGWLADRGWDANVIGSASMPDFIASVEACREDDGATADYCAWRARWPMLDRYANEKGRRERIAEICFDRGR